MFISRLDKSFILLFIYILYMIKLLIYLVIIYIVDLFLHKNEYYSIKTYKD
jgi:hypothetical protein